MLSSDSFERCRNCVSYTNIYITICESRCRVYQACFEDITLRYSMENGELLRPEFNNWNLLSAIASYFPAETELACIECRYLKSRNARAGDEQSSHRNSMNH
jgi:hypothetical protein